MSAAIGFAVLIVGIIIVIQVWFDPQKRRQFHRYLHERPPEYRNWGPGDRMVYDTQVVFYAVGYYFAIAIIGVVGLGLGVLALYAVVTGINQKVNEWRYPPIETGTYSTGWFGTGVDYRITESEGGEIESGAYAQKAYVSTEAVSVDDFKTIALDIEDEYQNYDFLWIELYEDSIYDTTGVVAVINSEAGEQLLGGGWTTEGGEDEDGVYILTGAELDGYPSGQEGFQEIQ